MSKPVQFSVEILPNSSKYFVNGINPEKVYDLITVQEGAIKVYNGCDFGNILIIDKVKNRYTFLKDTMPLTDKKAISDISEKLIENYPDDGTWLYDLKNNKQIYDYSKRLVEGDWRLYTKEKDWINLLCMDSMDTTPIKLYNTQNKHTLFWGIYYINRYMSNPFNTLIEDFGVEMMLNLIASVFNIEKFEGWEHNKVKILPIIEVWEKGRVDVNKDLFENFNDILYKYKDEKEEEEESEKKVTEEDTDLGLVLSKEGKVHLSDILNKKIPFDNFLPIESDVVTDPRIKSVHIDDGIVYFATVVSLDNRSKQRIRELFKKSNRKFVEVKTIEELNNQLELDDQFAWYSEILNKGGNI